MLFCPNFAIPPGTFDVFPLWNWSKKEVFARWQKLCHNRKGFSSSSSRIALHVNWPLVTPQCSKSGTISLKKYFTTLSFYHFFAKFFYIHFCMCPNSPIWPPCKELNDHRIADFSPFVKIGGFMILNKYRGDLGEVWQFLQWHFSLLDNDYDCCGLQEKSQLQFFTGGFYLFPFGVCHKITILR